MLQFHFSDPPRCNISTNFQKLKKTLQFQCIKRNTSEKYSPSSAHKDTETFVMPFQSRNSQVSDHEPLTSAISKSTKLSSTSKCPDYGPQYRMQSRHSVHFHLGSDDSCDSSEDDELDDDFGIKLLGFSDVDQHENNS